MRRRSKIELHVYRGMADPPEIVTVEFVGDVSLDAEAIEYWRRSAAKFYGNARVRLAEEGPEYPRNIRWCCIDLLRSPR